jgi:3-deoxy-7-phosphoheptulonate synthase
VIVKIKQEATPETTEGIKLLLEEHNIPYRLHRLYQKSAFTIMPDVKEDVLAILNSMSGVEEVIRTGIEYPLASKFYKNESSAFCVGENPIGGKNAINIIAGPCSVESEEQIFGIAEFLKKSGVNFIRGGAFKPRTSPYRFQGLGLDGLKLIRAAADQYNLSVVTEVLDSSLIEQTYPYADILQVGSRNMSNFHFLKQLGKLDKPVLLKRGMSATIEEWLMAAEYILSEGNEKVILCERGIRSFDNLVRNTMDISAIPLLKSLSHLPVWADPSHGTGRRELVTPVSMAAVAAGADGLIIEIHPDPEHALSDGAQSLRLDQFTELLAQTRKIAEAVNRSIDAIVPKQAKNLDLCVE